MMKMPIAVRIAAAMNGERMSFGDIAERVFPDKKSWRYQANGGPPGCYMALSAALRRLQYHEKYIGVGPFNRIVYPKRPIAAAPPPPVAETGE